MERCLKNGQQAADVMNAANDVNKVSMAITRDVVACLLCFLDER